MVNLTCKLNERSLPSSKTMTQSNACLSFFSSLSLPNRLRNLLLNLYMLGHGQSIRFLVSSVNKTRLSNRLLQNKTVDSTFHFWTNVMNICISRIPLIPNHMSPRDLLVRKGSVRRFGSILLQPRPQGLLLNDLTLLLCQVSAYLDRSANWGNLT